MAADIEYLGGDLHRVALGCDLDMPLKAQLERARLYLGRAYAGAPRNSGFRPRTVAQHPALWCPCLRVLDAEADGVQEANYASILFDCLQSGDVVSEAHRLCDEASLEILLLPEGA